MESFVEASPLDGLLSKLEESLGTFKSPAVDEVTKNFEKTYEEVKQLINEHRQVSKSKRKTEKEISSVKEGIKKAEDSLETCSERTAYIETKINETELKLNKQRNAIESSLEVWNMLGIRFQLLGKAANEGDGDKWLADGDFALIFTKIDQQNPNKKFTVKVNLTENKLKIYETEPRNILAVSDLNEIEAVVNDENRNSSQPDFRALAVFVRKHIKKSLKSKK
ncbi:hypothetical protein HDE_01976 [Halotydeus destructor]|nr:hypothetical protein HDE_01976 [Halotydeus destructor]